MTRTLEFALTVTVVVAVGLVLVLLLGPHLRRPSHVGRVVGLPAAQIARAAR